jgi:hypothetical protein
MRPAHPLPLVVTGNPALLAPQTSTSVVSRSMVTGPSVSAAARSGASSDTIRPVAAARPASTACHCAGVTRRARPAAVVTKLLM